ncbi:MAG: DUF1214 domain-containing protein [Myxococcota bacterium]
MKRRDFLKTGAAAGALPWMGVLAAQAAQADDHGDASAAAFAELAELLGQIERDFIGPERRMNTADERAAGRFFLAHAVQHAFQFWFEADGKRPMFRRWHTLDKKLLGDNPDAVYYGSPIDPSGSYRIHGNVHGATYTSFTIEGGNADGGPSKRLVSTLNDTEFDVAPDGSYEILLSAQEPASGPRNWLRLEPDAGAITTRHYFEWERSAAADPTLHMPIWIEPEESPGPAPVMDDAAVAAGVRRAIRFLRSVTVDFPNFTPEQQPPWVSAKPNQFTNPKPDAGNVEIGYAAKDNVYRQAVYLLQPNQALEIRGRFPRCRFANVMLWNMHLQTPPYRYRQVSLNRKQVQYESDGSFKIVIAHEDPGTPNWLDTAGQPMGTIFWRFLLPDEAPTALRTRVVRL